MTLLFVASVTVTTGLRVEQSSSYREFIRGQNGMVKLSHKTLFPESDFKGLLLGLRTYEALAVGGSI